MMVMAVVVVLLLGVARRHLRLLGGRRLGRLLDLRRRHRQNLGVRLHLLLGLLGDLAQDRPDFLADELVATLGVGHALSAGLPVLAVRHQRGALGARGGIGVEVNRHAGVVADGHRLGFLDDDVAVEDLAGADDRVRRVGLAADRDRVLEAGNHLVSQFGPAGCCFLAAQGEERVPDRGVRRPLDGPRSQVNAAGGRNGDGHAAPEDFPHRFSSLRLGRGGTGAVEARSTDPLIGPAR
jgi:hypothetical protein